VWLWFSPFSVSYLSLSWGCSFCSVLVCQRNHWNVRSLASLLILDCWKLSIHSVCPWPNKSSKSSSTTAVVLRASGVIRLDCMTVICLYIQENTTNILFLIHIVQKSVRTFSAIAMPPVSLLSQQLNKVHWLKTCRANTSNYRIYVDSYTKWKAELFSAYLQKELIHDICVDFKPTAEMKTMQRPSRPWGKYFKLQNTV